jgi:hypothetical protein
MTDGNQGDGDYHSQEVFNQVETVDGILHDVSRFDSIGHEWTYEIQSNTYQKLGMENDHGEKRQLTFVVEKRTVDAHEAIYNRNEHEQQAGPTQKGM